MSDLVPAPEIEAIVGVARHPRLHYARAVSSERTVYILHSELCRATTPDLRDCPWSLALDRGIDEDKWEYANDQAVVVAVVDGLLAPFGQAEGRRAD